MTSTRVVVVGSGNAGYCAAHAARDAGAQVTLVEKAPQGWGGGNSYFTAGAFRVAHEGFDALAELVSTVPVPLVLHVRCVFALQNTLWVPGTDHAGIATQVVVEVRKSHPSLRGALAFL